MDEHGMRNVHVVPAGTLKLEAQIHVIERDRKRIFVETPHGEKLTLVDKETSACHRADVLRQVWLGEITWLVARKVTVCMPCCLARPACARYARG